MLPARRNNPVWVPDLFNDFFDNSWMERPKATCPAINVLETPEQYQLELAAPGMTKADFDIHLDEDGDLVIKMEKKQDANEQKKGHYVRREFSYTKFQQTMLLPDDADREKIDAKVINGELKVSIPKIKRVPVQDTKKTIEVK